MDAARTLLLFLCVFLAGGLFAGSAGVVELRVRAGDTVTLPCDIRHQTSTLWMIQRPLEVPLIAAVAQVSVSQIIKEVEEGYRSRLSLFLEPSTLSVSLTLANLTESDRALYYCADRAGGRLSFGNGTELVFPGSAAVPVAENSSLEEPDRTVVSPSPCLTCWTLLPSVSVVCVIVSSVCVFSCVSLRRGSRSSESRPQTGGHSERQDSQEEEAGLQYATIEISRQNTKHKKRGGHNTQPTTYAEIKHGRRV
ncbi:uncharacterized protein [Lepisosteus oculatus]|uniref:uncharacterized protein isoform X1 n=1 Tax=Lepisosteus oculatus TaxID=7918 RepID=UPI0035F52CAD